ncbi:MAG: hypothetical protein AAFQ36_01215 [Pseudomonadota bacterium]
MEAFIQLIPLLTIVLSQALVAVAMVNRKGLGSGAVLAASIPLIGGFVLLWIASKTDKAVLEELERLRNALEDDNA